MTRADGLIRVGGKEREAARSWKGRPLGAETEPDEVGESPEVSAARRNSLHDARVHDAQPSQERLLLVNRSWTHRRQRAVAGPRQ